MPRQLVNYYFNREISKETLHAIITNFMLFSFNGQEPKIELNETSKDAEED